eukprot:gb/GFBE01015734.1/.p1 GENE.gb/GFBE01015734.1/~~gb/GFBE01015734.1/.p1  ORF type:complete len:476 (+),score=103.71 gb/GFBE01015734.1/:1-1428(+)
MPALPARARLALAVLGLAAAAEELCPTSCRAPHCDRGAAWNGGVPLVAGEVCRHTCSRKFGKVRYCGRGAKYERDDSVNCTGCNADHTEEDLRQVEVEDAVPTNDMSIREALLKEARKRLTQWYEDKASLNLPYWSLKAKIQQTKQWYHCDWTGSKMRVPITFGEFNVTDVRPVQVFNVLADMKDQTKWDDTVSEVNILGDFKSDSVRGVQMLLPSGIWLVPPREVFQWSAFNGSLKDEEFWFAVTTLENDRLHEVRHVNREAVQADNCMGAYWVRPCPRGGEKVCPPGNPQNCCPDGGSRVLFTSHVNVHPPALITAKSIFDVSWPKQVEWINALKKRARLSNKTAVSASADDSSVAIPAWLWKDEQAAGSQGTGVKLAFPHQLVSRAAGLVALFQRQGSLFGELTNVGWLALPGCAALALLGSVTMRALRSRRTLGQASADTASEDDEEGRPWTPTTAEVRRMLLAPPSPLSL